MMHHRAYSQPAIHRMWSCKGKSYSTAELDITYSTASSKATCDVSPVASKPCDASFLATHYSAAWSALAPAKACTPCAHQAPAPAPVQAFHLDAQGKACKNYHTASIEPGAAERYSATDNCLSLDRSQCEARCRTTPNCVTFQSPNNEAKSKAAGACNCYLFAAGQCSQQSSTFYSIWNQAPAPAPAITTTPTGVKYQLLGSSRITVSARKTWNYANGKASCQPIEDVCIAEGARLASKAETELWLNNGGDRLGMPYGLTSDRKGQDYWFTAIPPNGLFYGGHCNHRNRFFLCSKDKA